MWLTAGPLCRAVRGGARRRLRPGACAADGLRVGGQSAGLHRLHLAGNCGDTPNHARIGGHHRGGRLPHDGSADRPEPLRSGVRRCRSRNRQCRRVAASRRRSADRTRAVMIAHTLGNPFDLATVTAFCERHGLYLIEDCCDALGATYRRPRRGDVRRPRHRQLLSGAPHHHGRGRRGADQSRLAA